MNKIPRVAAGVVLGGAAFYGVHELIEQPAHNTYAVENVRNCAKALGDQAVSAVDLSRTCHDYADTFTPAKVNGSVADARSISFRLPKPIDFLNAELPNAVITDQNVVKHNTNETAAELVLAGLAGLAVGFAVGTSKRLKNFEQRPPRQKREVPLKEKSSQTSA